MTQMVPASFTTARLRVRAVNEQDTDALLALFNANSHVGAWDPTFHVVERPEVAALVDRSLHWAEHDLKSFQMQCFERLDDDALVGYYHCHYGNPHPDNLYISMFVMAKAAQRGGYGREVVDALAAHWMGLPAMHRAWAEVWLKNWPALHFWIARGFTQIIEWEGDTILSDATNASLILEKRWRD